MIPVNEPVVSDESKVYVNECLDTRWISSAGKFVEQFEQSFAKYLGVSFATTTSNGTTALHLAMEALGIAEGDEVIMPDLTIISCPFAALYVGAKPVLVDVDPQTGNIDPAKIEEKITSKTKAILVVHLYGHAVDMDLVLDIAKRHNLFVIEDAAEAHGAEYKGKKLGSLGDVACFSFYGNKIVSTGEGGMLVTNSEQVYKKAKVIKDLAHSEGKRFFHERLGYNFRLTNIQAALGCGELQHIEEYIQKKRWMAGLYTTLLQDIPFLELPIEKEYAKSVYWMYAVLVKENSKVKRDELLEVLKDRGIDTRTFFYPLHTQPVLFGKIDQEAAYPVSTDLSQRGFYLPSGLAIVEDQIQNVSDELHKILR